MNSEEFLATGTFLIGFGCAMIGTNIANIIYDPHDASIKEYPDGTKYVRFIDNGEQQYLLGTKIIRKEKKNNE